MRRALACLLITLCLIGVVFTQPRNRSHRQRVSAWKDVAAPTGWTYTLPFTIQRRGRTFRPDPSFNLQRHAGITVATTYYVDKATGNNGNTGLSWAQALADFYTALGKTDVDRIYIKTGYYYYNENRRTTTRSIEVIGIGSGVWLTSDFANQVGAWSPVDSHYETTIAGGHTTSDVRDATNADAFGFATGLTQRASVALVDSNANSWYQSGTTLYVRTFDSRAPDASIRIYDSSIGISYNGTGKTLYAENVNFYPQVYSVGSGANLKIYFKNVTAARATLNGQTETILQNCVFFQGTTEDGINHADAAGVFPNVIEIDVESYNHGDGAADQASTSHNAMSIVRINSKYHHSAGQCIADVTGSKSWLLGVEAYNPTSGIAYYSSGTMWLDRCWSHNNATYDIQNIATYTTFTRSFRGDKGANDIGGTLAGY